VFGLPPKDALYKDNNTTGIFFIKRCQSPFFSIKIYPIEPLRGKLEASPVYGVLRRKRA
jgi:hypothetical protein